MKPSTEKLIARIMDAAPNGANHTSTRDFYKTIELCLREQDRDTRHVCAEAVSAIASEPTISGTDSPLRLVTEAFCQRAHAVCMNIRSI